MERKISMSEIVIVAAARTPIGAFMGGLGSVPADQLGATVIKAALAGQSWMRPRCRT